MLRRALILATIPLLTCAGSAAATPGPRYASPSGTPSQDCTTPATACDIATAIDGDGVSNNPVAGQEIIVEPGTYTLSATLTPTVNTVVHGAAGQPRPVIRASGFMAFHPTATAMQLSDLEFDLNVPGNDGINETGATLDQLVITGSSGGNLCQCYGGVLRNSLIVDTGSIGGAWGIRSNGGQAHENLRNDTFIATRSTGFAIALEQSQPNPVGPLTADVKNVIALNAGGGYDLYANGTQATITVADSDFANATHGNGGSITDSGGNITAAPSFVNAAGGDYHEQASSPTVDDGIDDPANDGTLDLDGSPRRQGAHTDIGAYEYASPAAIALTGGASQSATVGTAFALPLTATVTDAQGNAVSGVQVTFTAPGAPSAAFAGAATAQAPTGADGVATAPTLTAGTHAGHYAVTAGVAGVAASATTMTNLPGAVRSLGLIPGASSVPAAAAQRYRVETLDAYGNDIAPVITGVRLSIAPNGSCAALSCSARKPGAHTVTAVLGSLRGSAHLTVIALHPRLGLRTAAVRIALGSRTGRLGATCRAPRGEMCAITGTVKARFGSRRLTLGTISGRVRAGTRGTLTVALTKSALLTLRAHTVSASARLAVVDLSGRTTIPVRFTLTVPA